MRSELEKCKETCSQLVCQDLNANLFTLDHTLLALMSVCVCVYIRGEKYMYLNKELNS